MWRQKITLKIIFLFAGIITITALTVIAFVLPIRNMRLPLLGCCLLVLLLSVFRIRFLWHFRDFYQRGTLSLSDIDEMDGNSFEILTCDLLTSHGFDIAEATQASVDYGVDVLARKEGISYAIQCKCYSSPIGIDAVQQVYAGRAYYECHIALVLSNQYFTSSAKKLADKTGVILWDRDTLQKLL